MNDLGSPSALSLNIDLYYLGVGPITYPPPATPAGDPK